MQFVCLLIAVILFLFFLVNTDDNKKELVSGIRRFVKISGIRKKTTKLLLVIIAAFFVITLIIISIPADNRSSAQQDAHKEPDYPPLAAANTEPDEQEEVNAESSDTDSGSTDEDSAPEDNAGEPANDLLSGKAFKDLIGEEIYIDGFFTDGSRINWDDYRGKVVLVDFWTTQYESCRNEIKNDRVLYDHYHDAGFEVVPISADSDVSKLRIYEKWDEIPWKSISIRLSEDKDPNYITPFLRYRISGVPAKVLIDRDGKIIGAGSSGWQMEDLLEDVFPDVEPLHEELPFTSCSRLEDSVGTKLRVEGVNLDGSEIDWSSYRGKVVLVELTSPDRSRCCFEVPNNLLLYQRYHDAGFDILSFCYDRSDAEQVKGFQEKNQIPWTMVSNEMSEKDHRTPFQYYSITKLPTMILVDRDGKVIDTDARGVHLKELLEKLFPDVEQLAALPNVKKPIARTEPLPREGFPKVGEKMYVEGICDDGSEIDWESYRGKVVLVEFWWSPACRGFRNRFRDGEDRSLIYHYGADRYSLYCYFNADHETGFGADHLSYNFRYLGFDIITICLDKDPKYLRKFDLIPWKIVSAEMTSNSDKDFIDMFEFYRIYDYPTRILVDREGKVVDTNAFGLHLKDLLEKELRHNIPKSVWDKFK